MRFRSTLSAPAAWAAQKRLYGLAGRLESLRASFAAKQLVECRYDGMDWEYTWGSGRIYYPSPGTNPVALCTVNLPLFNRNYDLRQGDVVLDIGAGIGTEVLSFATAIGGAGRLIAVEADPDSHRRLNRLVEVSGLKNVTTVHAAVMDMNGFVGISRDGGEGVTNSVHNYSHSGIEVPAITLDSLVDNLGLDRIDFLKMNIEGAETLALAGMHHHWDIVQNWCISCHDFLAGSHNQTFAAVSRWMDERGLTVLRNAPEPYKPWVGFYLYASSE